MWGTFWDVCLFLCLTSYSCLPLTSGPVLIILSTGDGHDGGDSGNQGLKYEVRVKQIPLGLRPLSRRQHRTGIDSLSILILVAKWIHFTLFWTILYYETKSVHFLGLMNSAITFLWNPLKSSPRVP